MSIVQPKYLVTGVSQNKCFTVFSIALGNEVMGYMNGTRLQQGDWIEATIERGEDGEFAVHTYRLTESPMKTYYEYYLNTLSMETHVYVPPQEWCAANDFPDNDRFVYNRHLGKVALPTYDANKWKVMAAQRGKPFSAVVMMAPTYAKANEVGALFIVDRLDKLNAHHTDPSLPWNSSHAQRNSESTANEEPAVTDTVFPTSNSLSDQELHRRLQLLQHLLDQRRAQSSS